MKYINVLAAFLFVVIYSLGSIPPSERLNLWLVTFAIPFVLVLNLILLLAGLIFRMKTALLLLAALLWGGNYVFSTIGIKSVFKRGDDGVAGSFTVLNYNLSAFNVRSTGPAKIESDTGEPDSLRDEMVRWVLNSESDIRCFQEFPHDPDNDEMDLLTAFKSRGLDYYFSASTNKWNRARFGTLIVSRFPIVGSGDVMVSPNGYNRIAYADLKVGDDTIRIINVHLQSMQIKNFHPGYSEGIEARTRNVRVVLQKLKSGVFERSEQIKQLIAFVGTSPYPVVCVGDFNELPYSYSYQRLRKYLKNTFEESGKGFGFTYNGNTLSMLRIDNQFYSLPLRSLNFETMHSVKYTDHFPLEGTYVLP